MTAREPSIAQRRPLEVPLVRLDEDLPVPAYAREGDAGADLPARVDVVLDPGGGRALVPTGASVAIPYGFAGLILPRSGLALRHGVTVLNAPGLVDAGYRGELQVLLVNTDPVEPCAITRGERIAQLVIVAFEVARFHESDDHGETERGTSGWGSSGR